VARTWKAGARNNVMCQSQKRRALSPHYLLCDFSLSLSIPSLSLFLSFSLYSLSLSLSLLVSSSSCLSLHTRSLSLLPMASSTKTAVVVGASGRVGSSLVRQAMEAGYRVTAILRQDSQLPDDLSESDNLKVLRGSLDTDTLTAAFENPVTAVFTALSGEHMATLHEIVCKAAKGKTRILVSVHAAGLLDTEVPRAVSDKDLPSPHDTFQFNVEQGRVPPFLIGVAKVHLASYKVIANSGIPYPVICPPNMPDGPKSKKGPAVRVAALPEGPPPFQVSTGDVAAAMLMAVDTKDFHGRRVGVRML
jgi:uncharacterized protein YbjT (DUF2867 family)